MSIKQNDMGFRFSKEIKGRIEFDYPAKINSVKDGYFPVFYPVATLEYFFSAFEFSKFVEIFNSLYFEIILTNFTKSLIFKEDI